jgi:hypothetical protein
MLKPKILNQVQDLVQKHDRLVRFWSCCHPELGSGSRPWILGLKAPAVSGVLYLRSFKKVSGVSYEMEFS